MNMETVGDLLTLYDHSVKKNLDTKFCSNLLKELRKSKIRRPDVVLECCEEVLKNESGNEVWNLHEQLVVAALDTGRLEVADRHLQLLMQRFPGSVRVKRLIGMLKEAEGEYTEALELYGSLLAEHPSNVLIMRRKVCVHKAMGDLKGAVEVLNRVLRLLPAEAASWLELAETYLSMCAYEDAAHCLEELILLEPRNAAHHAHLAEAYFSIGGAESLLSARKHYSMSLSHQGATFNLRALYGLIVTCKAIESAVEHSKTETGHDSKVNAELLRWGKAQLQGLVDDSRVGAGDVLRVVAAAI